MLNPKTTYKKLSDEEKDIVNRKINYFTGGRFSTENIKKVLTKMNPSVEVDKSKDLMKIFPTTFDRIVNNLRRNNSIDN